MAVTTRMQDKYRTEVMPALREEFGIQNVMALPRLEKICLNMGLGEAINDPKLLDVAKREMGVICGQAPAVSTARIAVSNFRLRQGMKIGCRVTLRGARMYEFLDRLIGAAIPRIRDFRGVNPKSFDRQGNYSLGITEITIFPEVNADRLEHALGMDVTMVIRNSTGPDMSRRFLSLMGMPFAR